MPATFSIGVLCYGNYPELADKCLGSLFEGIHPSIVKDVRIGINECSEVSEAVIRTVAMNSPVPVYGYKVFDFPAFKYPIMRTMLFQSLPVTSTHWMWFDDDTYVKPDASALWLKDLSIVADRYDVIGYRRFFRQIRPGQAEGIAKQAWFRGKKVQQFNTPFLQGGWWVARYALMRSWNYPFQELRHNNGDVMLGHLTHQQAFKELVLDEKKSPVAVDVHKRRGILATPWPWQAGGPTDLSHHKFRIVVERLDSLGGSACPSPPSPKAISNPPSDTKLSSIPETQTSSS